MSEVQLSFEKVLRDEVNDRMEDIASAARRRPLQAGSVFIDLIVNALKKIGPEALKSLKKEDFLAAIAGVYDAFISKIDLPGPFDAALHPMLKELVLGLAGRIFDRFVPAPSV